MSAIRVQQILDETSELYTTLKSHKRYTLRLSTIAAILLGSVLNFISCICALVGSDNAPKHLTIWAGIVLGISFLWNTIDLVAHSDRIFPRKKFVSLDAMLLIDCLGFLSYLALLIANGIIVNDLWDGPVILYTYNSVPWMVCCGIHGFITLQSFYGVIMKFGNGSTCCPDCGRKAKNESRDVGKADRSALLGSGGHQGYQDIEADAGVD